MQQMIQLGQVVQPSILSKVETIVKNLKKSFDQSITDSEFCQVLGITPWHFSLQGIAMTVALFLIVVIICGIGN